MKKAISVLLVLVLLISVLPLAVLADSTDYTTALSYQKTATASSSVTDETPNLAVDGNEGTKWCSTTPVTEDGVSCYWLQVDLGSEQTVKSWSLFSKTDDGAEGSSQTVSNFKLQVLSSGTVDENPVWTDVSTVTGNATLSFAENLNTPVTGQYFRLWLPGTGCCKDGSDYPRVGEFHLYGDSYEAPADPYEDSLTVGKTVTANAQAGTAEYPGNTVDRNTGTKWAAFGGSGGAEDQSVKDDSVDAVDGARINWLQVDLGAEYTIGKMLLHSTIDGNATTQIAGNFKLQVKTDKGWETVVSITGNTDQTFVGHVTATKGRYFRVTFPNLGCNQSATGDSHVRIGEFHLFAATDDTAVLAVSEMIARLGNKEITADSEAAVTAARTAYDALTDEQKADITEAELAVLVDAEKTIASLKLDAPYTGSLNYGRAIVDYAGAAGDSPVDNIDDANMSTKWASLGMVNSDGSSQSGYTCQQDENGNWAHWITFDLGAEKEVGQWLLYTKSDSGLNQTMTTFKLQVLTGGTVANDPEWTDVPGASQISNQDATFTGTFEPVEGRYFRLWIPADVKNNNSDSHPRIGEFHLFAPSAVDPNQPKENNIDYINPLIGSLDTDGTQNNAGSTPYVSPPFAMTNFYVNTTKYKQGIDAYRYDANTVYGIEAGHRPMLHMGNYGQVSIIPQAGTEITPSNDDRVLTFEKKNGDKVETSTPYEYTASVLDGTEPIDLKFTSTSRASVMQFTYEADAASILLEVAHSHNVSSSSYGESYVDVNYDNATGMVELTGYSGEYEKASFLNMQDAADVEGFFVVQFSLPVTNYGTFDNGFTVHEKGTEASGKAGVGAYATFDTSETKTVEVRIGTSFISVEQARSNLKMEMGEMTDTTANKQSYEQVKENLYKIWEAKANMIDIEDEDEDTKTIFYTALYHTMQLPRSMYEYVADGDGALVYNHSTGEYTSGKPVHQSFFDDKDEQTEAENKKIYDGYAFADIACWDIFRAEYSMISLLAPEMITKISDGLINAYEEGGYMPKWPNPGYTSVMIGTHADSLIAEGVSKGFLDGENLTDPYLIATYGTGDDFLEAAYEAVYNDAMNPQEGDGTTYKWRDWGQNEPYEARGGLTAYKAMGYIPNGFVAENISRTLEQAYDDYCVAIVAEALGKTNDYRWFINRSQNYKNLYDPETGKLAGRDYYDTYGGGECTEGNTTQYNYFNPHDPQGLIDTMEATLGEGNFVNTLKNDFGFFWHGNEPSHGHAYLFNYAGAPSLTQKNVRNLMRAYYTSEYNGIRGNDDCGQMSAWYMFSAMGFYPYNPVSGEYSVTSPVFDKVTIHLPLTGNDFVIQATNEGGANDVNVYIQSAKLNDEDLNKPVLTWDTLMAGGKLEFELGSTASVWGSTYSVDALPYYEDATNPETDYVAPYFADSKVTRTSSVMVSLDDPADYTATIQYVSNVLDAVKLDGVALVEGADYTFSADKKTITIYGEVLAAAGERSAKIVFDFNQGADFTDTIHVYKDMRAALQAMIDQTKDLDVSVYTAASIQTAQNKAAEAQRLLDDENATDEQIMNMINEMQAALDALTTYPADFKGSLTLGREAEVSSFNADYDKNLNKPEIGKNAMDGDSTTKWCAVNGQNDGDYWLAVDLGAEYAVGSVMLGASGYGGESTAWNPTYFILQVEKDGEWVQIARFETSGASEYRTEFDEVVTGQKFRLVIPKNAFTDSDKHCRIYEFHLFAAEVPVNKTELEEAIAATEALNEADYTAESWAALEAALEAAEALGENATQDEVDAAAKALTDAIDALVEKPVVDKAALTAAIAAAEALDEDDYTADTWADVQAALKAAQTVANNEAATQDEVNAAAAKLNEAVAALEEKPTVRPIYPILPGIIGGAVETPAEFPFVDVPENAWFYDEVKEAWENDLIDGVTAALYKPDETLTVAQAIKLAAALHQMYFKGEVTLENGSPNWYDSYVDYAIYNGIIEAKYDNYTAAQMNAPISREEFVHIFHGAMNVDAYYPCNTVADNAIPDVKMNDTYADEIYTFYRAGILTGSDAKGTFHPESSIKRSEVAAILIRMFDTNARQAVTLN